MPNRGSLFWWLSCFVLFAWWAGVVIAMAVSFLVAHPVAWLSGALAFPLARFCLRRADIMHHFTEWTDAG